MYLKIKNGASTKQYTLTNAYAKPYIKVSGSILPLTTQDTTGLRLKVKVGNATYRPLEYGSASASATYYTTSAGTSGLSNTTALTRESTSGTSYLTRASTSGTSYLTKVTSTETLFTFQTQAITRWVYIDVLFAGQSTYRTYRRSTTYKYTGTCTSIVARSSSRYSYNPTSYLITVYPPNSTVQYTASTVETATYMTNWNLTSSSYTYTSSESTRSATNSVAYGVYGNYFTSPYSITQYTGTATSQLASNSVSGMTSGTYSGTQAAQTIFGTQGVGSVNSYGSSTLWFSIGSSGKVATTGTSYLTRSSTSATSYLTRSSTSGYSGVSSSSSESSGWK